MRNFYKQNLAVIYNGSKTITEMSIYRKRCQCGLTQNNYNSSSGKLFIAASLRLSITRRYFSVWRRSLCPNRFATVFMFAPLLSMLVAKECRAQCHVICLSMPARLVQWRNAFRHIVCDGKGNISASRLPSPISLSKPSFRGITTPDALLCPLVLDCSKIRIRFA